MGNLQGFDASKVEPNSFEVLPAGTYKVAIAKSEFKPTKSGDGEYLNLQLKVLEGEHKGRVLFDILNLKNKSKDASIIAQGTLSSICRAVGVMKPNDSSELHNRPMLAEVAHRRYNDELQNTIKAYKPIGSQSTLETELAQQAEDAPWAR